jgi:predicted ATPase
LFVERARTRHPAFELTSDTVPLSEEICRRLDGVPLALEIAACRIDSFDPSVLADVLDGNFRLHMLGRPTASPRHRTLAASLDWSFDTLSDDERTVLRRLSVFGGPFSFEAARHIVGYAGLMPADIGGLIASLATKSLIAAGGSHAGGKHRLLETTRAYARDKLERSGESDLIARRHALYCQTVPAAALARMDLIRTADKEHACLCKHNSMSASRIYTEPWA